jgi:hypothetical protein
MRREWGGGGITTPFEGKRQGGMSLFPHQAQRALLAIETAGIVPI